MAGLAAAAVLFLAWPSLRASYRYLPVEHAIERFYETREIPSDRLLVLMRFTDEALRHHDHYRYHEGLSFLHLLRAMDFDTPALERRDAYVSAAAEAEQSLRRAPAQPAIWLRLATVRWILYEEPEDILAAWKMSIFTGRTDISLLGPRVEIGLAYRDYMDPEAVSMLRDQLLMGWRTKPGSIIQILQSRDPGLAVTRPLIETSDPAALAEMEAWLAKLR